MDYKTAVKIVERLDMFDKRDKTTTDTKKVLLYILERLDTTAELGTLRYDIMINTIELGLSKRLDLETPSPGL